MSGNFVTTDTSYDDVVALINPPVAEAAKLGFKVAVVPKANLPKKGDKAFEGLTVYPVERIEEAMQVVRGLD